jgi:hypothetical protein
VSERIDARHDRPSRPPPATARPQPPDAKALSDPGAPGAAGVLALQRSVGNRMVSRMLDGAGRERPTRTVAHLSRRGGLAKGAPGEECTVPDPPAGGDVEVVVELGGEQEEAGAEEAGALAKATVRRGAVGLSVERVSPGPAGAQSAHHMLLKAATTVKAGAAPTNALGGAYGLTYPESVQVTIGAKKVAGAWHPVVKNLVGLYSLQARILPHQREVTGPSGNTTKANFCDQVTGLNTLGNAPPPNRWYMLQAVKDHEAVHATRFGPALTAAEPTITAAIEAVNIPHVPGMTQVTAAAALKADPTFVAAVQAARQIWVAQCAVLIAGDHAAGGPTDAAEHKVVDPMIKLICTHAKIHAWGPCPDC